MQLTQTSNIRHKNVPLLSSPLSHMMCGSVVDFGDVHVTGGAAAVAAVVGHVTEQGGPRLLLADLGAHVDGVTWWRPARLGPGCLGRRRRYAHCASGAGRPGLERARQRLGFLCTR